MQAWGGYFRDQDAPDLANVLYYAKQERDDIGIRIASMVKRMGGSGLYPANESMDRSSCCAYRGMENSI